MPVTIEQVLAELNSIEPDYTRAAGLGKDALPHLMQLVEGSNPELASKAVSLASLINTEESVAVVSLAAHSSHPVIRVAAAGALRNFKEVPTSLIIDLLNDEDSGVRQWTLKALETHRPVGIKTKVQEIIQNDPHRALRQLASQIVNQLP